MNKKIKSIKKQFNIKQNYTGWGRKKSGFQAVEIAKENSSPFLLLEDGFIRSIGLGDDESFSIVEDDIGIYYDATSPSRLENILNNHKFNKNEIDSAKKAINLIKEKKISKYNNGSLKLPEYLKNDKRKVLIIAQTEGDMSLKFGYGEIFNSREIVKTALKNSPNSQIYLKVHPDVIAGKKKSNIDIDFAKKYCQIIDKNIHPIVLLEAFEEVYTQTSQMGFEALLLNKKVHIFGAPFYVGWNIDNIRWYLNSDFKKRILQRRNRRLKVEEVFYGAYKIYSKYYNPFNESESNLIDAIETISKYRDIYLSNNGKLFLFGFSFWKREQIKYFFKPLNQNQIFFCKNLDDALKKGIDRDSKIYIWGKKRFLDVESFANEKNVNIFRVEDGFIRSVTLGSDLTKAYSLVFDSRGVYFDPTKSSDLEEILNSYQFSQTLISRAENLKNYLINKKISKYNIHKDKKLSFQTSKKIVLVIGQVEDDASIIYGGNSMSNLELLKKVYERRENEFIIYKPHPDVLSGNRKGSIPEDLALKYATKIISNVSLPSLLDVCDEVHTITSLSGLEGLIRGKQVYTYGLPFYAGWGLTIDEKSCKRRDRKLTINELIAGTYIIYPRYLNPHNSKFCEVEITIREIEKLKKRYNSDVVYRFLLNLKNFISRKAQLLIKVILGE